MDNHWITLASQVTPHRTSSSFVQFSRPFWHICLECMNNSTFRVVTVKTSSLSTRVLQLMRVQIMKTWEIIMQFTSCWSECACVNVFFYRWSGGNGTSYVAASVAVSIERHRCRKRSLTAVAMRPTHILNLLSLALSLATINSGDAGFIRVSRQFDAKSGNWIWISIRFLQTLAIFGRTLQWLIDTFRRKLRKSLI